jgi:UDP-N-acetylmuramate--alanine ligase
MIVDSTRAAGAQDVRYVASIEDLPEALATDVAYGDVVVTLGAGSIESVGSALIQALEAPIHA